MMVSGPNRPRATLGRQLRVAGGLLVVLLALAGVVYGLWWFLAGQPVLTGEHSFDLGTVAFTGDPVTLEHTFVLTNRRGRPIEIRDVKTSCGCVEAEASTERLEPGASVDIAASLTLKYEGIKEGRIFVIYGDGRQRDVLHVRGAARYQELLHVVPGPVRLEPGGHFERLLIYTDYDSNNPPPTPRITAPAGVRAEFTEWTQKTHRRRTKGFPARWQGGVRIERVGAAPRGPATVVVEVGADQKAEISLTIE